MLKRWTRKLTWNSARLDVVDEVLFPEEKQKIAVFRWHLGTGDQVKISGSGKQFLATWKDAEITLQSSIPISVSTEMLPDNTVNLGEKVGPDFLHRCIVVRTSQPCGAWTLRTSVVGKPGGGRE
ncbi:MAG: hypothetical protein U9N87_13430 [Planctomycetota bacterium]|nr:hypothetical protein [Planctomycetota bacterium]